MKCLKCNDTGFFYYDKNHTVKCDACCKHSSGYKLTKDHYGYIEGINNMCCDDGCGTMMRDLIKQMWKDLNVD